MANRISSPLTVLRFSCWHFSEASEHHMSAQVICHPLSKHRRDALRTFTRDKRYELRDTLLHALFRFFGDFGVFRQS